MAGHLAQCLRVWPVELEWPPRRTAHWMPHDFRVWTKASITLGANFWYGQRFGSIGFGDPVTSTWRQNVVDVPVGITFH